jgi:uncharacterized membrane protein SirB2
MEDKELIVNAFSDIITDGIALVWLLVFGLIANYIWKTPKLKKSVERIYKIMGFIITTVIVLSSITIIGLWVMQLLESEESLTAWIVTIAIGIIIWICAIVYIKSDNDNTYKEGLSEELNDKSNDRLMKD